MNVSGEYIKYPLNIYSGMRTISPRGLNRDFCLKFQGHRVRKQTRPEKCSEYNNEDAPVGLNSKEYSCFILLCRFNVYEYIFFSMWIKRKWLQVKDNSNNNNNSKKCIIIHHDDLFCCKKPAFFPPKGNIGCKER